MNMKKLVSIILATLIIMSMTTVFATDVTYPENLALGCYELPTSKTDLGVAAKVDTTNAEATATNSYSGFGNVSTIIDGQYMIGQTAINNNGETETIDVEDAAGTFFYSGVNGLSNTAMKRWGADTNTTPTITIDFKRDVTFNKIKYTEVRRVLGGYTVTWYNDGVPCAEPFVGEFTDTDTSKDDNKLYLREIDLGQLVTADKVEIKITSLLRTNKVSSITEMEFWADPILATANGSQNSTSGGVYKIFDGCNMIETDEATNTTENPERLIFEKDTQFSIEVSFANDITFNTIKFTEFKKMIKDYEVELYKDGSKIKTHTGSFDDCAPTQKLFLRKIVLDQLYTVDKIVFKAKEFGSSGTAHILEMEFHDGAVAPTVTTTGNLEITVGSITNLFDGVYDSDGKMDNGVLQIRAQDAQTNENIINDLTITFDLGTEKTFNYAELAEVRCLLGEIDVQYKDGTGEWKTAGTIAEMQYENPLRECIRSTSFDAVTARYVRFVVKNIAAYSEIPGVSSMKTININEVVLRNYDSSSAGEATIYPIRAFGENVNSLSDTSGRINAEVMLNNTAASEKLYRIIAAQYSAGGVLEAVSIKDTPVPANASKVVTADLVVNAAAENIAQNTVRYYVWDWATLSPYCPAVGIPYQN